MEPSNYNRGGNRGGRNTGGRGDNIRRGGGGYHHGGRGRNDPQQYGNLHQEHHGGGRGRGRGRGSGGVGGGRGRGGYQTPRTPAYPMQNADRVPDRFDSGREVNTWSRVVNATPQTLTQNLLDRQVQEVSSQLSSSLSVTDHSKDVVATNNVPIKRPEDRGTLQMRSVNLLVNHFPIEFDPSNTIFRYDVDIKPDVEQAASSSRAVTKSTLRQIHENLCLAYLGQFPLLQIGYDGVRNIFSAVRLEQPTYSVELYGRVYTVSIKFGNEINFSKLEDFLTGNAMHVPRDVLQALDVAMKANYYQEKVSVGRCMYPRVHQPEDDLGCGIAAYRGSQQSLKLTANGLVLCTDYSVMSFRKRMPVLEFLREHVKIQVNDIVKLKEHVKVQVNDIVKNRKMVLTALKGLKVGVTHRRTKQTYTVFDLSDKLTKDISFEMEDPEGKKEPETTMLMDYFRDKWGKEIVNKGIPCLDLGKGERQNYVPMEFCLLAEDRRFPKEKLGTKAAKKLKELSLLPPDKRMGEICNAVGEEYATGCGGEKVIKNFGTSKATHYTAIWDEIRFSSDELQRMIYDLCYVFARCTKPVSLVTPVSYADLLAYRGRMFQEALMEMELSGLKPPSCSFDQALYNLDQHLKDSMFFI